RRMLESSRQCRMALPPFANTANGARIRPAPIGQGIERNSQHRRLMHDNREWLVARLLSCESRDLSRRIILRILRRTEDAFTSGNISAGLIERKRRSNNPRSPP